MNLFQVKIIDEGMYLVKYKVVRPGEYHLTMTDEQEEAGEFDEDDLILKICAKQFTEINVIRTGSTNRPELGTLDDDLEVVNWM